MTDVEGSQMPEMLAKKIAAFRRKVATAGTPEIVLSGLRDIVRPYDVDVLAIGVSPRKATNLDHWILGRTIFFGTDDFWPQYQEAFDDLGWDALTIKAEETADAFTFAEAAHEMRFHRGSWIFELHRSCGRADGLFCPGKWNVVYGSQRYLGLSPALRSQLISAAHVASSRIQAIVKTDVRERSRNTLKQLTPREIEVLQVRTRLRLNAAIARELNISKKTVEELLRRARLKLDTRDTAIALLTAYKLGLIRF
jgi:DNA-binding CsgD family transcriptional regulator